MKRQLVTHRSQKEGARQATRERWEWGDTEKHHSVRMGLRVRAFIVVSAGRNGGSRDSRLGLAGLNTFSRSWGTGAVPACLVPGPGVIRALNVSSTEEVFRDSDS